MEKKGGIKITPDLTEKKWDVVIIGSGLAGMTAAVGLANEGKRVLLLEQHYIPGGYATCFKRKGFTFEVSLHQMPGLGKGDIIHNMLSDIGVMNKIIPIQLNETMYIQTNNSSYLLNKDFFEQLNGNFPEEKEGIEKIDNLIYRMTSEMGSMSKISNLPKWLFKLLLPFNAPTLKQYADKTLKDCLDEILHNEELKQLIAVQWGYFGLPLSKISSVLYLIGLGGFMNEGIYYIKGTSQSLSNAYIERLEELNGQLLLKQKAEEIIIENGKVAGVRTRTVTKAGNGEEHTFKAPIVISNANPYLTYKELLDKRFTTPDIQNMLDTMEPSISAFCVYLGLDCPLEQITKLKYHSVVYLDDEFDTDKVFKDIENGTRKKIEGITDYSLVDPNLAPEGKGNVVLIRVEFMQDWDKLSDEEYKKRKQQEVDDILNQMEERYPGFKDHIEVIDAATPKTMKRYTLNHQGAFNGFAYTTRRVSDGSKGFPMKTPIKGLYLSSAWIDSTSGGYYGSIAHGYKTAKILAHHN